MAVQEPIQWREPVQIAAGDTLKFQRRLNDWLPADGWAITLTVTTEDGQQVFQTVSGPDPTNNFHTFNIANFLGAQPPGNYILSEEVICAPGGIAPGEQHQIYEQILKLLPNLNAGAAIGDLRTRAQKKLAALEATYDELSQKILQESDAQRNRFLVRDQKKVEDSIRYWKEVRVSEIQVENAKNGRPPGNVIQPLFSVGF